MSSGLTGGGVLKTWDSSSYLPVLVIASSALSAMMTSQSYSIPSAIYAELRLRPAGALAVDLVGVWFGAFQLALLALALYMFYRLGRRVAFRERPAFYCVLVLCGAVLGSGVGYWVFLTLFASGSSIWQAGMGYVTGYGLGWPVAATSVVATAVGGFTVPLAGMGLADLGWRASAAEAPARPSTKGTLNLGAFAAVCGALAALTWPVIVAAQRWLGPDPLSELGSRSYVPHGFSAGLAGFVAYPAVLIPALFLLGRASDPPADGLRRLAMLQLAAAAAGGLVGYIVALYIESPGSFVRGLGATNPVTLAAGTVVDAALLAGVALGAATLGMCRTRRGATASVPPADEEAPLQSDETPARPF